jgi:multimeric flavodoxin WrbA
MKVTAIVGSPRREGQSARLVEEIVQGVRENRVEVALHYLGEKNIKPCLGCYSCEKNKKCVIKNDDMQDIYKDMESSDAYVFASPVYFNQVSGLFKLFIDRIFPYYWDKPMNGRKGIFTLVYEDDNESLYHEVVNWFTDMVKSCHGIEFTDTFKVHGANKRPISENKELLAKAREAGERLVTHI